MERQKINSSPNLPRLSTMVAPDPSACPQLRLLRQALVAAALLLTAAFDARAKPASSKQPNPAETVSFESTIKPLLEQYCYNCHGNGKHKGDLALDAYPDLQSILNDRKRWETVLHHLSTHEMPPAKKPQPSDAERDLIAKCI